MAKPRPEKKRKRAPPAKRRVLPMELRIGDRLIDKSGKSSARSTDHQAVRTPPLACERSASPISPRSAPGAPTSASP